MKRQAEKELTVSASLESLWHPQHHPLLHVQHEFSYEIEGKK